MVWIEVDDQQVRLDLVDMIEDDLKICLGDQQEIGGQVPLILIQYRKATGGPHFDLAFRFFA